jgi:preprotein translocase subunit SecG
VGAIPPGLVQAPLESAAVYTLLSILQIFIAVTLVFLVLLHSGKDSGLSGAFGIGGAGAGPFGGGSLVERNLNRWTVAFGIALFVNSIILLKI